ncbi:MAG: baseplate J/gp47 family protein [Caldilineaceae bacterium]|nr:baseplate J/gp47 family protein [Caldilineaceae bacterium]
MSDPICPCETVEHPRPPNNPPGRAAIGYRVGDFTAFRAALLRVLQDALGQPVEQELAGWSPTAQTDLALQMVEWFAYLADILTFYNERIATESYLGTATQPESVRRLIRVLGYRPRPGIAATGLVAALANSRKAITVPLGFQIQSKPGPGQEPQIFEVDAATAVQPVSAVAADPPDSDQLIGPGGDNVLLAGDITTIAAGSLVLLLPRTWTGGAFTLLTVQTVTPEKDPRGKTNTRVTFTGPVGLGTVSPANYQLFYSVESAKLYPYPANTVITDSSAVLDTIRRGVAAGDKVLFSAPGTAVAAQLVVVTATGEVVYYANTPTPATPTTAPASPTVAVPIPATQLFYSAVGASAFNAVKGSVIVRFGWREAGTLIAAPASALTTSATGASITLAAAPGAQFPTGTRPVLLEDAIGDGLAATGQTLGSGASLLLTDVPSTALTLTPPLTVLFNTLPVSRGKTVAREILGSGDATRAGQEFVPKKAPLTYLADSTAPSGAGYRSTLRVWVNGVEWVEQPSFYNQSPAARIFVTREDDDAKTHVQFGDGVNGARLPSGVDNVVAAYRYGSGADTPDAGSLTVVLKPLPGLQAIRNPVAVGGGADPDPSDQIKRYAPQSVMTFGRAISGVDYETLAAQTPGVDRARAYWSWDPNRQRTLVTVHVGDTPAAVQAADAALAGAADPNRPIVVKQAVPVAIRLSLTLLLNPAYLPETVTQAVSSALLDATTGLFGLNAVRIGQSVFRSQIYAACLAVPGVTAVHDLQVSRQFWGFFLPVPGPRYVPGEGKFFVLDDADLNLTTEVAAYG